MLIRALRNALSRRMGCQSSRKTLILNQELKRKFTMSTKIVTAAEKHLKIRWVGVPLLIIGIFLFLCAIREFSYSNIGFFPVLLGVACSLMGLTCFGVNHDTAICLAMEARREDDTLQLSPELQEELEEELRRDRSKTLALQANPTIAVVLPFVVCLVQGVEMYLVFWAGS